MRCLFVLPDSRRRCRNSVLVELRCGSGAGTHVKRPMQSHDSTRLAVNEIACDSFWMTARSFEGPPGCLVSAAEASERESMSFETQHRFVTAQPAHQLLQAVHCPSHGDFLPIASYVLP